MRIAARTSSEDGGALADFPMLRDQLEAWKARLAEVDWIPWVIIGLAAFLRFFLLGIKPPHFDEGINGWFVDAHIIKEGFYKYDPTNYHGPLHFYVLLLSQTLFGRNLWGVAPARRARKHRLRSAYDEIRAVRRTDSESHGGAGHGGFTGLRFLRALLDPRSLVGPLLALVHPRSDRSLEIWNAEFTFGVPAWDWPA